eukprot:TRINITY_DN10601_c0_g2_i5.p1 TRINITY_DN10601_c0_g2~~TRINITY_DN10601_c0_g2_i5.p1  ORF type:complete len:706 (-),score=62.90 TRINITY_DN10601_c0_g2_i5:107-2224(-)
MEVQNRKPAVQLVFQHGKREQSQTFFNMATGSYHVRSIGQMRKKDVCLSSHGWLLLRDSRSRCCLFNPASLKEFDLPQLTRKHRDCLGVLSASPTDPNCQLILIKKRSTIFYSCKITQDSKFDEVKFNPLDDNDMFVDAISCKGKIYFFTCLSRFGEISVGPGNHFAKPTFLDVNAPIRPLWYRTESYLVESCGEVFLVCQLLHWTCNWVFSFMVFKMDFSEMRWVLVKSIGDRLFFLSKSSSQSCSAFESGLEGNQIFFFLPDDKSLYSFHMKERSISVDLTCPNVQPPWKSPFWLVHTSNEASVDMKKMGQSNVNIKAYTEKIQPKLINAKEKEATVKMAEKSTIMQIFIEERPWSDLPIEIVMLIATMLTPVAYARMRSICKSWQSIIPSAWLPLTPCLLFHEEVDGLYKFFDPMTKRVYAIDIPELYGATIHFSNGGWVLVSLDITSLFFFNPFTKERIDLPDLIFFFSSISFSSIPTSPDCVVIAVINVEPFDCILISTCSPGAQGWAKYICDGGVSPLFHVDGTNPVFRNGLFYCPGQEGNLGVYNIIEDTWNVLKIPMPLEVPRGHCFLMESKGELLLVYLLCTEIHIFSLDESKMVWVEVEVLEDLTLFLSRSTSLAMIANKEATTTATKDMMNKVYISRFFRDSNDALVYNMESKSHHLDFYKSKEFINCTWIDPTSFEFALDPHGNILSVTSRFR